MRGSSRRTPEPRGTRAADSLRRRLSSWHIATDGQAGRACYWLACGLLPALTPEVAEGLLARLGRSEPVRQPTTERGIDRKTVRAWRAPGAQPAPCVPAAAVNPSSACGRGDGAGPEVDFNPVVLCRQLVIEVGYSGPGRLQA